MEAEQPEGPAAMWEHRWRLLAIGGLILAPWILVVLVALFRS
jgi:hypothetical protein